IPKKSTGINFCDTYVEIAPIRSKRKLESGLIQVQRTEILFSFLKKCGNHLLKTKRSGMSIRLGCAINSVTGKISKKLREKMINLYPNFKRRKLQLQKVVNTIP